MELKPRLKKRANTQGECSNRTFMELKLMSKLIIYLIAIQVLIVPLWN